MLVMLNVCEVRTTCIGNPTLYEVKTAMLQCHATRLHSSFRNKDANCCSHVQVWQQELSCALSVVATGTLQTQLSTGYSHTGV